MTGESEMSTFFLGSPACYQVLRHSRHTEVLELGLKEGLNDPEVTRTSARSSPADAIRRRWRRPSEWCGLAGRPTGLCPRGT